MMPAQGWEICPGGVLEYVGDHWYRCPTCQWVGWKIKRFPGGFTAPAHQRPKP